MRESKQARVCAAQVFVALLRTCQQESKNLVKEALDILTPALPRRLEQKDQRVPMWIRYTKKVLVEEGHSLPHLVHIWQLVVRIPYEPTTPCARGCFRARSCVYLSAQLKQLPSQPDLLLCRRLISPLVMLLAYQSVPPISMASDRSLAEWSASYI